MDVLVFMVDSADRLRLPWARQELHKLLDKDPDLPVVVVANKQVRDAGGWLRPVELDPQIPGQGQGALERDSGPGPGPGALGHLFYLCSSLLSNPHSLSVSPFASLSSVILEK